METASRKKLRTLSALRMGPVRSLLFTYTFKIVVQHTRQRDNAGATGLLESE